MDPLALIVLLFLLCFLGAGPWWPYAGGWGYGPFGLLGLIFFALLVVWLLRAARGPTTRL